MDATMSIGQLAGATGVAPSALRFWESRGLLQPIGRSAGGYRRYDAEARARVGFIRRAQALGLSLDEVSELLAAADGEREGAVRARLRHLVAHKLDETRRQLGELEGFISQLERVWYRLHETEAACSCRHLGDCACLPPVINDTGRLRLVAELGAVTACVCGCEESTSPSPLRRNLLDSQVDLKQ